MAGAVPALLTVLKQRQFVPRASQGVDVCIIGRKVSIQLVDALLQGQSWYPRSANVRIIRIELVRKFDFGKSCGVVRTKPVVLREYQMQTRIAQVDLLGCGQRLVFVPR